MTKKDRIQLAVTGVLTVVLILLVLRNISRDKRGGAADGRFTAESLPVVAGEGMTIYERLKEESRRTPLRRDPFSHRLFSAVEKPAGPTLSGIVWDEQHPTAIIDGVVVGEGDRVGDRAVVDIQKERVLLNDGTKDIELLLNVAPDGP